MDKANLFATSRLWRAVVGDQLAAAGVPVRNVLVDRFAFELAQDRVTSGLVITEGLFGDILSDLAAARAGSIALCSSASINPRPTGRLVGHDVPHTIGPRREGDPPVLVASAARAGEVLGWRARRTSLDEIIGSALEWRRRNPKGYRA